ncbi:MAG: HAMP domain-containing histidine kinase [Bacteroidales bacterium]|nr:HAMP domain-containing histidine kinase [Bacteroidales bacterium]MCM1416055.1 HAMP domain-containing histidine kinase [bacterium]MCM1424175.1 HAMP domain-containing histidine kinase [bacterium]
MIAIIGILCLLAAVIAALADFYFRRRSLRRMNDMIQAAIDGTFRADLYDESMSAAVENKLAEYLAVTAAQTEKTVAEQEKTKTLIADISHQTKTPIANLLLYTELLKEEGAGNGETAALLENQVKKLDFLIQSLVKLSRLETGILVLHPGKCEVLPLLEEAEEQYAARAREKGLYLRVLAEGARGVTASFDPKWTLEALGNLIDNAIKYTREGGVTVRVKPYELFVCIEVEDTGIGIAEEEHAKIFGRFYRSPAVADEPGVGIGLYLTREILRQQSGYLKLSSKEGEGAVFSMYLAR